MFALPRHLFRPAFPLYDGFASNTTCCVDGVGVAGDGVERVHRTLLPTAIPAFVPASNTTAHQNQSPPGGLPPWKIFMLRKSSYLFTLGALAAIAFYCSLRMDASAQQPPAAGGEAKSAPDVPAQDPFAVPSGTDEQALHLFLTRITQLPPPDEGQPEIDHFNKFDKAVAEILSRPIGDELFANVAQLRFQVLAILQEVGDKTAAARQEAYLKELSESTRPGVKSLVARAQMQSRLEAFITADAKGQQAFIDEIVGMIKNAPKGDDEQLQLAVDVAMDIGMLLERTDSPNAGPTYRQISEALASRGDDRLKPLVASVERTLNRLELPGKVAEINGTTLTGKEFDVKEYRGKVVLVDFWATWCGACVMELPELQELYSFYHDKGLEVLGVSVDTDRDALAKFVTERKVPWVQLFEEESPEGKPHSISDKFGINMFPTMLLLDREGKVLTVQIGGLHGNSGGTSIAKEIEKILGPMPKKETTAFPGLIPSAPSGN